MSIITPRQEYSDNLDQVVKNRDCTKGQRSVKDKTTTYLPALQSMLGKNGQFTKAGRASYENYINLALFYGATGITVSGFQGLIFRKNPVIELTPRTEYLLENISASNELLTNHANDSCYEAMITPRSLLLVDHPKVAPGTTIAEQERLNLRPKILHFPYESIINWNYTIINNERVLEFVVLRETVSKNENYHITTEYQYRLIELIDGVAYSSLWDAKEQEIEPREPIIVNGQPARKLPVFMIEVLPDERSLIDQLVDVNLNHYRMFASYANKEFMSGFAIYYETGVDSYDKSANNRIGPGIKWESTNPDAQFGILEPASDGGSLKTYLDDRKSEMATLGADALSPRTTQAESGESKKLDKIGQNATIADVANTVSRAYAQALKLCAEMVGDNPDNIEFQLNTDYIPQDMNPQLLTALMAALQSEAISYETFYRNLQKGEIADPSISVDDELARIGQGGGGV